MFSLRAVQTTGRSLPLMTTTTLRRILTQAAPRVSPIARKHKPSNAAGTAMKKRVIHSVVLPWPSTSSTPEPELTHLQALSPPGAANSLQRVIEKQKGQLFQQEKDIKRLKTLVMQPGFFTQRKWVYECRTCGEVGVGMEVEGKGKSRMMELLGQKGEKERYDVL